MTHESAKQLPGPEILALRNGLEQANRELLALHEQLLEQSFLAGMTEFADSLLGKIGNILNSINVSSTLISETVRHSHVRGLGKVVALLQAHQDNLADFFAADPKGRQLPGYLDRLSGHVAAEQQEIIDELVFLKENIRHVNELVARHKANVLAVNRVKNGNNMSGNGAVKGAAINHQS